MQQTTAGQERLKRQVDKENEYLEQRLAASDEKVKKKQRGDPGLAPEGGRAQPAQPAQPAQEAGPKPGGDAAPSKRKAEPESSGGGGRLSDANEGGTAPSLRGPPEAEDVCLMPMRVDPPVEPGRQESRPEAEDVCLMPARRVETRPTPRPSGCASTRT